jgi:hypothetical protein
MQQTYLFIYINNFSKILFTYKNQGVTIIREDQDHGGDKAHFAQAYVEELLKVRSAGSSDPCWSCQPVLAYLP